MLRNENPKQQGSRKWKNAMEAMKNKGQGYLTLLYSYLIAIFKLWFFKEKTDLEKGMEFYLPSQILAEIFYRLPQKSLAICKAVSKQWNYCINNYHFVDEYRNRNPSMPYLLYFDSISRTSPYLHKLHICSIGSDSYANLRTMQVPWCYDYMLPSSFGLVCLYAGYNRNIAVFNTTTAELIPLPNLHEKVYVWDNKSYNGLGFGYDPQSRKYKVVQMAHDLTGNCTLRSCYVLTVTRPRSPWRAIGKLLCPEQLMNMNLTDTQSRSSWRKIDLFLDCKELIIKSEVACCVNGNLYWETAGLNLKDPTQILMFDLSCDNIELIPSPVTSKVDVRGQGMHLVELQGRLAFVKLAFVGGLLVMDISKLNYSRCCVSWDLIHRLEFGPFSYNSPYMFCFPLCVMQDRILLMDHRKVYSYDLEEKSISIYRGQWEEDEKLMDPPAFHRIIVHAETLVFLN